MKIKKHMSLVLASLCMVFSFSANAQSPLYIKGSDSVKSVESGNVYVKSDTGTVSKDYDKVIVTNGNKTSNSTENTDNEKIGTITATSGLNVRSGPGTGYSTLGALNKGDKVTILEEVNGWYKINYKNTTGYVSALYVTIDGILNDSSLPSKTGRIKKIVIDAGHGGSDPGAIGPSGLQEKKITLSVSLKLKDILESRGVDVVLTRSTDIYLGLQERVQISNNNSPDFFLSVHNNSFSSPTSNGTETFSYMTTGVGAELAKSIQKELIKDIQLTDRGFKTANYYVIKYTKAPAALVELAFISNPNEESLLASDAFQNKCAVAIARAILNY